MSRNAVARDAQGRPDQSTFLPDFMLVGLFTGLGLFVFVILLAAVAWSAAILASDLAGLTGARIGFGVGVALGVTMIGLLLRVNRDRLTARSAVMYRGLWLGLIASGVSLGALAFAPHLALPNIVCTPGVGC